MLRAMCAVFAALLLFISSVRAEENKADSKPVADLIKQLDADEFADRQTASKELAARGKDALPALIEAATGTSPEASTRALEILKQHHEGADAELKTAAKEALQKLASGDGAAAKRAGEVLAPKPAPVTQPGLRPGIAIRPGIRVAPDAIRIAVAAGAAGGGTRISVKNVDGVKEIEAVEGDRTTKINEDPDKGIKVKVTTKTDGKEETKEYEAKNAEELKEKHPEAHEIYAKYNKMGGGAIRIEGLRIDVGDGAGGIRRIEPPAIIREPSAVTERIDAAKKQLDEAVRKLSEFKGDAITAEELAAAKEAIKAAQKELEEVRAQFPMR